jgi:hypothetical protein
VVELFDQLGRSVLARTVPISEGRMSTIVNTEGLLPEGAYLVAVTAGEQRTVLRGMIRH